MTTRSFLRWFAVAGTLGGAAAAFVVSCIDTNEVSVFSSNYDGGYLGPCSDAETHPINPKGCPALCSGPAVAVCVNGTYAECACVPTNEMKCDSGCCPGIDYTPRWCDGGGKVAIADPAEGQCAGPTGYLLCNDLCFSTFVCELPSGYRLLGADAGSDAGRDGAKDGASDSDASPTDGTTPPDAPPAEVGVDGAREAGDAGVQDASKAG